MKFIKQTFITLPILAVLTFAGVAGATPITLYDDTAGNTPGTQPWLLYADDNFRGGTVTETAVTNVGVNLTTDNTVSAGYSNYQPIIYFPSLSITYDFKNSGFPTLDRALGYSLSFELQINSETHVSNDRAGFSVILLGDDSLGIELGFWEDEIWAQDVGFTHGEGTTMFDTTANEVLYELAILDSSYELFADNVSLLSGDLRDYSSFGASYSLSNYLFLGDDTSSAGADITLGEVILNPDKPVSVPEPSALLLLLSGLLVLRRFSGYGSRA